MSTQTELVKEFFDEIAEDYKRKFNNKDEFYRYFFYQRLNAATEDFEFNGRSVLDIGAGSGALHDYFISTGNFVKYYGTDISENILNASNIKNGDFFVGNCYEHNFEEKKFNFIYMLGVTTYVEKEELQKILDFIYDSLQDDATAIITFTNRFGIDNIIRYSIRKLLKPFIAKNKMLSGKYNLFAYSKSEINNIFRHKFKVENVKYLNHTFFPFSKILKRLSVRVAKSLSNIKNDKLKSALSSDLLYVIKKK